MARIKYSDGSFQSEKNALVPYIQEIIEEYSSQGYLMNGRGYAYRLEGRGIIIKTDAKFQQVEDIVADGREYGLIDWDAIPVDSARVLRGDYRTFDGVKDRLESAAFSHRIDKHASQPHRIEVVIEKEGLLGVIGRTCEDFDIPYRATKGYDSLAGQREAALRVMSRTALGRTLTKFHESTKCGMDEAEYQFLAHLHDPGYERWLDMYEEESEKQDQGSLILWIGDHDSSGYDLERKYYEQLVHYGANNFEIIRVAISCEQSCRAPGGSPLHSAPVKSKDTRSPRYIQEHNTLDGWEVESMEPSVLNGILRETIMNNLDREAWEEAVTEEERQRNYILSLARYED